MNTDYRVEVIESNAELTPKQKIRLKNLTSAVSLDIATEGGNVLEFKPVGYAVLKVHNEKSEDKEYLKYVVEDNEGHIYETGSKSFWNSFMDIFAEMQGSDEEWSLQVFKIDSKKYTGKQFITCDIV